MPVLNRLKEVLEGRQMTAYALAAGAGLPLNTCYRLSANPRQIPTAPVLEKLCRALNCQPGDLLVYMPGVED